MGIYSNTYGTSSATQKSATGKIKIAVVVLVIGLGGLTGGIFLQKWLGQRSKVQTANSIRKEGRAYVNSILKGDLKTAYNSSSKELRTAQTENDYTATLAPLKADKSTPQDADVTTSLRGNTYTYSESVGGLPVNSQGATEAVFTLTMVHEDGAWKVKYISVQ